MSAFNAVGNLGGSLGSFALGWIKHETKSFEMGLHCLALSSLAPAVITFFVTRAVDGRSAPLMAEPAAIGEVPLKPWPREAKRSTLFRHHRHFDLASSVEPTHHVGELGAKREPSAIMASKCLGEPVATPEEFIGEADHQGVRPGLPSDGDEALEYAFLRLMRIGLHQQGRHGGGGARDSSVAMNEQMRLAPRREVALESVPKGEDLLDMPGLGKLDPRTRLDRVGEMHLDAVMRIIAEEGLGFGPIRIENREHMRDSTRGVIAEFVEAADGEIGERLCRHGSTHITAAGKRETVVRGWLSRATSPHEFAQTAGARGAISSVSVNARKSFAHGACDVGLVLF